MKRFVLLLAVAAFAAPAALAQGEISGKLSVTRIFKEIATAATESTVRIRCDGKDAALGTVMDENGLILTKGSELSGLVSVRLRDGSEYDAETLGYDEKTDLTLLKIDATDLVPIKFVDAKLAEAGNMVAAPGLDKEPVAFGIISAPVRRLFGEEARIQKLNKGYLGIRAGETVESGAVIGSVSDGSPAKKAKLQVGDQIFRIDDRSVNNFEELSSILEKYRPGDKVTVHVRRRLKDSDEFEELSLEVKLGSQADLDRSAFQNRMGSALSNRRTGFPKVITTDLVIKPTDCGGPIVDLEGRALGITIARAGRVESWVLPKDVVATAFDELKAGKHKIGK